ncbi:MAG: hypothetical protein ACREC0_01205 [Methylocella sp.]
MKMDTGLVRYRIEWSGQYDIWNAPLPRSRWLRQVIGSFDTWSGG